MIGPGVLTHPLTRGRLCVGPRLAILVKRALLAYPACLVSQPFGHFWTGGRVCRHQLSVQAGVSGIQALPLRQSFWRYGA